MAPVVGDEAKEDQFSYGDLVLAKVKGFPAWPAKISRPEDWKMAPDPSKYFVHLFGTKEIAFVAPGDIQPFTVDVKNKLSGLNKGKVKYFGKSVKEICEEFEQLQKKTSSDIIDDNSKLEFGVAKVSADSLTGGGVKGGIVDSSSSRKRCSSMATDLIDRKPLTSDAGVGGLFSTTSSKRRLSVKSSNLLKEVVSGSSNPSNMDTLYDRKNEDGCLRQMGCKRILFGANCAGDVDKGPINGNRTPVPAESYLKAKEAVSLAGSKTHNILVERSEACRDDKLISSFEGKVLGPTFSLKNLIAAAQVKRRQAHLQNSSGDSSSVAGCNIDREEGSFSPGRIAHELPSGNVSTVNVPGFIPHSSIACPLLDVNQASSINQHVNDEVEERISSGNQVVGGLRSGGSEVVVARVAFEGMIKNLSRAKESIGRATRQAIESAKYGIASEVIELLIQQLENEPSFRRKVNMFFLVDSIAQCSHNQKGIAGASYIPIVRDALPRILRAAAPPDPGAHENRRQCLKVLRLWLERKVLPDCLLQHYIDDIGRVDDETSVFSRKHRFRAERSFDDPMREMEGILVNEYGSNVTFQLPSFLSSQVLHEKDEEVVEFPKLSIPEGAMMLHSENSPAAGNPENHSFIPSIRSHHVLENVDGEVEMEDVSGQLEDEMSYLTGDAFSKLCSAGILNSASDVFSDSSPLPEGSPLLPHDSPPITPPLPTSPPPSLSLSLYPPPSFPALPSQPSEYLTGVSFMNLCSVGILNSALDVSSDLPPLPEGSPPLPHDSPPMTPPLPTSPPPSPSLYPPPSFLALPSPPSVPSLSPPPPPLPLSSPNPLLPSPLSLLPTPHPPPPPTSPPPPPPSSPPPFSPHLPPPSLQPLPILQPPICPAPMLPAHPSLQPPQTSILSQHISPLPTPSIFSSVAEYHPSPVPHGASLNSSGICYFGPLMDASMTSDVLFQQAPCLVRVGAGSLTAPYVLGSSRSLEYRSSGSCMNSQGTHPNQQPGNVPSSKLLLPPPPQNSTNHCPNSVRAARQQFSRAVQKVPPCLCPPQYSLPSLADRQRQSVPEEKRSIRPNEFGSDHQLGNWMSAVGSGQWQSHMVRNGGWFPR